MARRLMEKFLPTCAPPLGLKDQIHALLLVNELVTAAIEYVSAPRHLELNLICWDGIFTAALSGDDGLSLVARELRDETLRGPAIADLAHIAHRCGSHSDPENGDLIWVELDLAA
jgi:hypothetical protein